MNWLRFLSIVTLFVWTHTFAWGADEWPVSPVTNKGERWQVAYYEGGDYVDYRRILVATVQGLMDLGWVENQPLPDPDNHSSESLWQWVTENIQSRYILFRPDAYYSAEWDVGQRAINSQRFLHRLNNQKDIDLVLALGTWAGQDLANDHHSTATMVLTASNPVSAGIIKSVRDSGFDHLHATVDPSISLRQMRIFHELVGFKSLGLAYEDSVSGRSYAAVDQAEALSFELGFEVVPCHTKSDVSDQTEAEASVIRCMKELASKVDAVYLTVQGGVTQRTVREIVSITLEEKVATFSQRDTSDVKAGVLFSLVTDDFSEVGLFEAKNAAKIFNGALAGRLRQIFEAPPRIAVNTRTAELIGYDPPLLLLGAADEIYKEIEKRP